MSIMGSKKDEAKLSKEELKAKKAADAEAKKAEKERKAAEAKAKREAAIAEKKAAKNKPKEEEPKEKAKRKSKQDSKMQQEKSQLAKDLGIRISSPYGYYPDDVDPIITKLQNDLKELTLENKKLRDEVGSLQHKNTDLTTELTSLKLQISITDIPVSLEDSLSNLSQLGDINGEDYEDAIPELASNLLDDEPDESAMVPEPSTKPKIKLNFKNGGNT